MTFRWAVSMRLALIAVVLMFSAGARGSELFHTRSTVFACIDPGTTRSINAASASRFGHWLRHRRRVGDCFEARPDQRWELISHAGGMSMLRLTPPRSGEPPLYFRVRDLTTGTSPGPATRAAATAVAAVDQPSGASAPNPLLSAGPPVKIAPPTTSPGLAAPAAPGAPADSDHVPAPSAAPAPPVPSAPATPSDPGDAPPPAPLEPPAEVAPVAPVAHAPPPAPSGPASVPNDANASVARAQGETLPTARPPHADAPTIKPARRRASRLGAAAIGAMVGIAAVLGVGAWAWRRRRRTLERDTARRVAWALQLATSEILRHKRRLRISKAALANPDYQGAVDQSPWSRGIKAFCDSQVVPVLAQEGLSDAWPLIEPTAVQMIEDTASEPAADGTDQPGGGPQLIDGWVSGADYEQHCATMLNENGWSTQSTAARGERGAGIIARKDGDVLFLWCQLSKEPVGRGAVAEVSTARVYHGATFAAIVSNAAFMAASCQLAATNGVFLLHHDDLRYFSFVDFTRKLVLGLQEPRPVA